MASGQTCWCVGIAAAMAVAAAASAQDASAPTEAVAEVQAEGNGTSAPKEDPLDFRLPPPFWTVKIEPRAWWVSPSGDIKLPAASGSGPGSFTDSGQSVSIGRLNFDTPRMSAAGEVEVAAERWRFAFSAGSFSLDRDQTTADAPFRIGSVEVSPGEQLSTRMDYATFELTLGYELWSRDFQKASKNPEDALAASMRLIGLGGGRIHDIDIDVTSLDDGTSAGSDQTFFEVIAGVRAEGELLDTFSLSFQATVGAWYEADRSVFSFDMQVAFRWVPVRNFEAEIGWRQMLFTMADGEEASEFEYDGGMAGLFAGVVVKF